MTAISVKRNYRFLQFLMELFALFQLYIMFACIIDIFNLTNQINAAFEKHGGGEIATLNPVPSVIWGVLSVIVFAAAVVLPFLYARKTKLNQKQFDMWVYAVYMLRVVILLILFYMLDIHARFIRHETVELSNIIDIGILTSVVLAVIIVRFTQIRIKKAAEPEKVDKREFTED